MREVGKERSRRGKAPALMLGVATSGLLSSTQVGMHNEGMQDEYFPQHNHVRVAWT